MPDLTDEQIEGLIAWTENWLSYRHCGSLLDIEQVLSLAREVRERREKMAAIELRLQELINGAGENRRTTRVPNFEDGVIATVQAIRAVMKG